jgi:hypothetical protein
MSTTLELAWKMKDGKTKFYRQQFHLLELHKKQNNQFINLLKKDIFKKMHLTTFSQILLTTYVEERMHYILLKKTNSN